MAFNKTVMEKPFKDCKVTLLPCLKKYNNTDNIGNNRNALGYLNFHTINYPTHSYICSNPALIKLTEESWDIIFKAYPTGVVSSLCKNYNAIRFMDAKWNDIYHFINWSALCENIFAIPLIEKHIDQFIMQPAIALVTLFENPYAIDFIDKYWDDLVRYKKISYGALCSNSCAIPLIKKHWQTLYTEGHINWVVLFRNPNAVHLIDRYWDIIQADASINITQWNQLCYNENAVPLIKKHLDWMSTNVPNFWSSLCINKYAMSIIMNNWNKVLTIADQPILNALAGHAYSNPFWNKYFTIISNHINIWYGIPGTLPYIKEHWNTLNIDFTMVAGIRNLCLIADAELIVLIEKRLSESNIRISEHSSIWSNPNIFVDEYRTVATKWFKQHVTEELMASVWHPRNIAKFASWGIDIEV